MNRAMNVLAVLTVLAGPAVLAADPPAAAPAAQTYHYKTPKLNRTQIDALLSHPDKLLVIDVRRPDELTKIGGFPVYLSIQAKDLEQRPVKRSWL